MKFTYNITFTLADGFSLLKGSIEALAKSSFNYKINPTYEGALEIMLMDVEFDHFISANDATSIAKELFHENSSPKPHFHKDLVAISLNMQPQEIQEGQFHERNHQGTPHALERKPRQQR